MTVKTILLQSSATEGDQRQIHLTNMATLRKAHELRKKIDVLNCIDHPDHGSVLIVRAMPSGMIHIDRSEMCCDEFYKGFGE